MAEELKNNNFQYCFSTEVENFYLDEGIYPKAKKFSNLTEFNLLRKKKDIYQDVDRYNDGRHEYVINATSIIVGAKSSPCGLLVTRDKKIDDTNPDKMIVEFRPVYNEHNQKIMLNDYKVFPESLNTSVIVCNYVNVDYGKNDTIYHSIKNPYTNANILKVYFGKEDLSLRDEKEEGDGRDFIYGITSEEEHYTERVFDGGFFKFTGEAKDPHWLEVEEKPLSISNEKDILGKIISKVYVNFVYEGADPFDGFIIHGWMVCASDLVYSKDLIGDKVTVTFEPIKDQYGRKIVIPDSSKNFSDVLFKYKAEKNDEGEIIFRHLLGDELVMREFQSLYEAE